jgi:SAM-dependent methyltransferase
VSGAAANVRSASESGPLDDAGRLAPATALDLYDAMLRHGGSLLLRAESGRARSLPLDTWLGAAGTVDERVLDRARGPVLDVGCGPGRHVHALARRGVLAVGVDISPVAVALARRRGATVLEASIFDRLPGAGRWRTTLVLDGNIGIGGRPDALLRRVAALLAPRGVVLVELDPPGVGVARERVRIEAGGATSAWFAWARVGAEAIAVPARAAGLRVVSRWLDGDRWFAALEAP